MTNIQKLGIIQEDEENGETAVIWQKPPWLTSAKPAISSVKYTDQCPQHIECSQLVNDTQLCTSVPTRKSQERVSNKFMPVVLIIVII